MKLVSIAANQTETQHPNGTRVFYSYQTPVAAYIPGRGYVRTAERHSNTTSRHTNAWLDGRPAETVPQSELDNLTA